MENDSVAFQLEEEERLVEVLHSEEALELRKLKAELEQANRRIVRQEQTIDILDKENSELKKELAEVRGSNVGVSKQKRKLTENEGQTKEDGKRKHQEMLGSWCHRCGKAGHHAHECDQRPNRSAYRERRKAGRVE